MNADDLAKFNTETFKAQFKKEREYRPSEGQGNSSGSYQFIARLLLHPVSDGRHRLLWLVLAPYAVTILKLNRESAIFLVMTYMEACDALNPCSEVLGMVEQYIEYSSQIDLHPSKLETIRASDPDMAEIIERAIEE